MPPQTPSDTIQASSRHPQALSRHPQPRHRRLICIVGYLLGQYPLLAFANGFGIDTSSDLLSSQTNSRHHPDTLRQCLINTTQTPPVICKNVGHWKERQYLSFMTFYNILQRHLELIHRRHPDTPSRHHPDAIQTPPDTIQTPSDIFMQYIFMQYRALYIVGKLPVLYLND